MANVRSEITLSDQEMSDYLDSQKTLIMGTLNHDGWPHIVPMWFARIDGRIHMHTYKTSQKVRNLERDARGSVLVEDGTEYNELRGVFMRGKYDVVDDQELCYQISLHIAKKYHNATEEDVGEVMRAYVRKRVALVFTAEKVSSWDHGKM